MNSHSMGPSLQAAHTPEPEWLKRIDSWRETLERCSRRPGKKRVHAIRVATLRLQAPVEVWLRERSVDDAAGRAARKWLKQAEKLRKTLSPVRDLDVLLDLIATMQSPDAQGVEDQCRAGQSCVRELARLEQRLRRRREAAKEDLAGAIKKKKGAFDAAGESLRRAFDDSQIWKAIDASGALREEIAGLAQDAPALDAETLHDFRKRAKTARYLAEIAELYDPAAKRMAALLKKIQTFAGEWHDLHTLAERAEQVLKPGKNRELVPMLQSLAERSLESALVHTRRVTSELAALASGTASAAPAKFAVRRAEAESEDMHRLA